jgi:hypothetical protein
VGSGLGGGPDRPPGRDLRSGEGQVQHFGVGQRISGKGKVGPR